MAFDLRSGVKIYDNDWFVRHHLSEEALADYLADLNLTYVLAQSRLLPMEDSAVKSRVSDAERRRYNQLDDFRLRRLLAERGIAYVAVLNICFDPVYGADHPEDVAVDQWGDPHRQTDWYFGVPPDRERNLANKEALLRTAVKELDPDGVHLGFIRWPGFWETWLPGDNRSDKPDYCYSSQTLQRFSTATGVELNWADPVDAAATIAREHQAVWTKFKCSTTADAIGRLRRAVHEVRADTPISINTLPFFAGEFDAAVTEVFGQDVETLGSVVDIFEVMAYHQILARGPEWPAEITADIRRRSGNPAICTVQAAPLYLDGIHAGHGRREIIDAAEFAATLGALETSSADGLCVFTLTQLLDRSETDEGRLMLERLRRFRL